MTRQCNFDPDGACQKEAVEEFTVEFVTDEPVDKSAFHYRLCDEHAQVVRDDINNDPQWVIKE